MAPPKTSRCPVSFGTVENRPLLWIKETQLEAITNFDDEFDAMTDFGIHLEFDMNDLEENEINEISWQDLCEILCE